MNTGENSLMITLWKQRSLKNQHFVGGFIDLVLDEADLKELKRSGSMRIPVVGFFPPARHERSPFLRIFRSRGSSAADEYEEIIEE
jgi:hypothetical protein